MGGKKSGGAATPSYEAPNTLNSAQSLRIIDAVCEGEIRGFANGNDAPWKSVFLNDTPVQNADGSFNFKGLAGFFLRGTPDQPYIPGFDVSERTVAVSAEVKKSTPIVRAVTDKLVGRLRVTLGVDRNFQVQGNGDTLAAQTVLRVELVNKDGVRAVESVTFSERAGGVYYQDVLFDQLPEAPFNIRVSRLTDDAASDKTGNKTYFASFVEMIDAKLSYPHTVLAALSVDSDQFGNSVPRRNYLLDGMLVNVPSNYNPDTREYAGSVWDGSFKKAWTNNPAWVFYDVLTQPRYSTLARRLKAADIDKWTLYQVAKYCDELVDDGFGGKEPRFVCNAYLSEKRQAAELLTDLASVFRGLPVWDGRRFSVVMDADADAVAQYANSNVKDGLFTYSGAAFKSISTAVMVQYVDKYDGYRTKTEYVQDDEAVRRYGLNVRQVAAFGCDSRGQAARFGAWMLQTGLRQQDAVSFTVGREGLRHLPYDVVRIMDNDYAGADFSGRLKAVSGLTVTLDRPVEAEIGSRFSVEAGGALQTLEVMAKPAADRLELSAAPQAAAGDVWVLQGRVKARLYRVVSSKENTADGTFTVSALRHDPQKYGVVDGWAKFDREITTLHNVVPQLMNPSLTAGGGRLTMTWDNLTADGQVLTYDVKIYRDNVLYRHIPDAQTAEIVLENLPNGSYRAEIRGRNARGVLSEPLVKAWSLDYTITGVKAEPRLQAVQLDWVLPQTVVNDVRTEIWYAESNNRDAAKRLTTLPYPQNSYTLSGVAVSDRYWFWLRLADAAGNSGEWTAAVAGRSDPNPAPIVAQLRGAIEKSSLSQALIDSLDADAASKVAAEAQARAAAIQAASKKAADDLAAEAQARAAAVQAASKKAADDLAAKARELGTKITVVENVNAEQAQQIRTVTASQGATAAGLEAEKKARADGDRAEAQARETLTGRLNAAEGSITAERQARIKADEAQTAATEALKTRVGNAEGGITALRETVSRNDSARATEIRQLQAKFTIPDTRNDNQPPSWYFANHPRSTVSEFKQADVLGLGGGFAALETVVPWRNPTGGRIFQTAYLQDGIVMRRKSDTVATYADGVYNYTKDLWTEWAADETANGAQAKADAVRRVAEAAQAAANKVDADLTRYQNVQVQKEKAQAEEVKTLKASLSGVQTKAEAAQAAANKVDADLTRYQNVQVQKEKAQAEEVKTLKASIDSLQVGGRNLIRDSAVTVQNANYLIQTYALSDNTLQEGEPVVVTIWGDLGSDREAFWPFNSNGWNRLGVMGKVSDGVYRLSATWVRSKNNPSNDSLLIYCGPNTGKTVSRIDRIKLERGTVGTDWTPAPEDGEAATADALNQARQDAQAKADAAKTAAEAAAQAKADAAKAAAIAAASNDAQAKASAAKAAAIADAAAKDAVIKQQAAADAQAKADAVRRVAEAAQAAANKVDADLTRYQNVQVQKEKAQAEEVKTLKASLSGVQTKAEAAQAAANKVDADLTRYQNVQVQKEKAQAEEVKTLKASIDSLQVGGRNLIRDSAVTVQNANYLIQTYALSDNTLQEGEPVVVTIWGDLGSDREAFWPFNSNGWNRLGVMKKVSDGVYRLAATWVRSKNNPSNDRLLIYCGPNTGTTVSRIDRIKLERGTVGTDWTPAPEDGEAATANALNQARQDAQAKADAAKTAAEAAAQAKADAAKTAAEAAAQAKADAAKAAAIAAASNDAQSKANAAKAAAIADAAAKDAQLKREAAADAQAKADAVRRVAEAAQAAANRVDADLTEYRKVQVQKEKAQAEEVKTLKAEAAGQKAEIEQSANALASLDGKVRAMYGLKVETVSGGRKVIAGLALGADGQTGDSQMLVYADKFAVVDPKSKILKSPFVVQTVGGKTQMALSGDFVADGLIHGRHIAAGQTLSSPSIEGGSLNIGGGRFSVSNTGQVSISAASGNVGLKITNDKIQFFNERGVLIVELSM